MKLSIINIWFFLLFSATSIVIWSHYTLLLSDIEGLRAEIALLNQKQKHSSTTTKENSEKVGHLEKNLALCEATVVHEKRREVSNLLGELSRGELLEIPLYLPDFKLDPEKRKIREYETSWQILDPFDHQLKNNWSPCAQ
jgi:hypothetical protein